MARRACWRVSNRQAVPTPVKPLIGFSDITALHLWMQSRGFMSIHGPVLTQLGRLPDATAAHLFALLESASPAPPLRARRLTVTAPRRGRSWVATCRCSRACSAPRLCRELSGAVLMLEDLGERPYRLDRMWTHLQLAGVFERIRGLVLGSFTDCEEQGATVQQCRCAARTGSGNRPALCGRLPVGPWRGE